MNCYYNPQYPCGNLDEYFSIYPCLTHIINGRLTDYSRFGNQGKMKGLHRMDTLMPESCNLAGVFTIVITKHISLTHAAYLNQVHFENAKLIFIPETHT